MPSLGCSRRGGNMSIFYELGKVFGRLSPVKPLDPFAPKEEYHRAKEREALERRWDTGRVRYPPFSDDDFFMVNYETGWVRICYVDSNEAITVRDISLKYGGSEDFEAYCALRDGLRLFRVAQIKWIQETEVPLNLPADWKSRRRAVEE